MNKFLLGLCAAAGLAGVFGAPAARADYGDDDYGYRPRYRHREEAAYREDREDRTYREPRCRSERVYVIERDCPVRREVYFDAYGRCFYPAGPRRVYVENYYREYPRFYRHPRPHVGVSFSFGG